MECRQCLHAITSGMELVLDPLHGAMTHCPYCLEVIEGSDDEESRDLQTKQKNVSVKRFTLRRRIREQFVDRLTRESADGSAHCPSCDRMLNTSDQILLRNTESFKCHTCGHDLASMAYRQECYNEQRWLPVIYALNDLRADPDCAGCRYFGAMARACQEALSWIPKSYAKQGNLLKTILARTEWTLPEGECRSTCFAIKQYRTSAKEGLILL
jgi:hypothetical protein